MSVHVRDIVETMKNIAPLGFAEEWDNVGLIVGSRAMDVTKMMLTIDCTDEVIEEAVAAGAQMLITYHPIMFHPVKRITDDDQMGRLLLRAMHHDLAVYSPHTALDAAPGGVTDWLADAVGSGYRRPLIPHETLPPSQAVKIVSFVPAEAAERLRDALAHAGAGRIGQYTQCAFMSPGIGSFRGDPGTRPAIGDAGALEHVEELRLEMVCSESALPSLIATLREFHPYEEPAFDLYHLHPVPEQDIGAGRKIVLDQPATVGEIANRLKSHLNISRAKVTDSEKEVNVVGIVPGAGASLVNTACDQGCDLFVTGEMTHHQALAAELRGCSIILTGHTNSERGYLRVLRERLLEAVDGISIDISQRDRTRFEVV